MDNTPKIRVKVRLETAEGHLVGEPDIPSFMMLPEVLLWGNRVFKQLPPRVIDGVMAHPYAEVFYYAIPDLVIP